MASFSVVSNISSVNAQANLEATSVGMQRALNRLSSGFRINYSGDDAAGLAVANGYRTEVAVLNQGIRNANDGLSTLQIKDGALNNISTLLDRLSTLASQSASAVQECAVDPLDQHASPSVTASSKTQIETVRDMDPECRRLRLGGSGGRLPVNDSLELRGPDARSC